LTIIPHLLLAVFQGFFLKVYTQYVTTYSKATRELAERKKKSTRFAQFLDVRTDT
jgi:hypothetical protein